MAKKWRSKWRKNGDKMAKKWPKNCEKIAKKRWKKKKEKHEKDLIKW